MFNQSPIRDLVAVVVITIFGTFLFSYVAFVVVQNAFPHSPFAIWNQWDAPHYLHIAQEGYTDTGEHRFLIAYLPFYPLLVRLFVQVFNDYVLSALIVSNIAYSAAAYYLYKLTLFDYKEESAALRSVLYFSIFPTAYFLHAGYTESLFLALIISSFYYARLGKWRVAGLLGMLAPVTRITGIILFPVLVLEYLSQKEFRIKNVKKDALWLVFIPLGFTAYLSLNYYVFGDSLQFLEFQKEHWFKTLAFPWEGLLGAWSGVWWRDPSDRMIIGLGELVFAIFGFLLTLWAFARLRLSYGVYMLLTWLIITCNSFWLSIPRYTLTMFPLFIALSVFGKCKGADYFIIFISLLFYALLLTRFVSGLWTF